MRRILLLLLVLLPVLGACRSSRSSGPGVPVVEGPGPEGGERVRPNAIIAIINDEIITRRDLDLFLRFDSEYQALAGHAGPQGITARRKYRARVLDDLIAERVLIQLARSEKLTLAEDDTKRVEERLDRIAEGYGSRENLAAELQSNGLSLERLQTRIEETLLIRKLESRKVLATSYVSPAEVRAYHDALLAEFEATGGIADSETARRFFRPAEVRVRQVVVNVDDAGPSDARTIAEHVRREALAGTAFESLVRQYSSGPRRDEGGLWVVASEDDFAPPLGEDLKRLAIGEVSEPIVTPRQIHVAVVESREGPRILPFSSLEQEIRDLLRIRKLDRALRTWRQGVIQKAHIRRYLEFQREPETGQGAGAAPRGTVLSTVANFQPAVDRFATPC